MYCLGAMHPNQLKEQKSNQQNAPEVCSLLNSGKQIIPLKKKKKGV